MLALRRCAGSSLVVVHGLSCPAAREIFLDQGLDTCLLHWQADSLPLRHQENPADVIFMYVCMWFLQVLVAALRMFKLHHSMWDLFFLFFFF